MLYAFAQGRIERRFPWAIALRAVAALVLIWRCRTEAAGNRGHCPGDTLRGCALGAAAGGAIGLVAGLTGTEAAAGPGLCALELCLFAPIREEIVLRGMTLERLGAFMRPQTAILVTALLFSAAHGPDVRVMLYCLGAGIILGAMKAGTGGVLPAIVAHAAANAAAMLLGGL